MLQPDKTILLLIDIQGKLAELMYEKDLLYQSLHRLITGAQALSLPVLWMEQIPEKMGPTIQQVRELLTSEQPISKKSFSCCGEPIFNSKLGASGRKQVLIAGIETHVCVYQTASDLVLAGYETHVVADAVSSRTFANKQIGLDKLKSAGAQVTSVETTLFEMMRTAEHKAFKDILKIVR